MPPRDDSGSNNPQRNNNYRPIFPPNNFEDNDDQMPLTMAQLTVVLNQWQRQLQQALLQTTLQEVSPIQPMLLQIQEQMQQLQSQLLQTQEQMQESHAQVLQMMASTDAFWRNSSILRFNKEAFTNYTAENGESCALTACHKVSPGLGPGLLGFPPQEDVVGTTPAAVGTFCPPEMFPSSCQEWSTLTDQQISNLAAWENNDFGILEGDGLQVRRRKYKYHISMV